MSVLIGLGILRERPGKDIGHVDKDPSPGLSRWTRSSDLQPSQSGDSQLRVGAAIRASLVFGATASVHRHFHGPAVDYVGLAAAAGASWAGVPGPGEPVLIAAAVYAARHRLDITEVLIVAFVAAASVGSSVGWSGWSGPDARDPPGPLRRAAHGGRGPWRRGVRAPSGDRDPADARWVAGSTGCAPTCTWS